MGYLLEYEFEDAAVGYFYGFLEVIRDGWDLFKYFGAQYILTYFLIYRIIPILNIIYLAYKFWWLPGIIAFFTGIEPSSAKNGDHFFSRYIIAILIIFAVLLYIQFYTDYAVFIISIFSLVTKIFLSGIMDKTFNPN